MKNDKSLEQATSALRVSLRLGAAAATLTALAACGGSPDGETVASSNSDLLTGAPQIAAVTNPSYSTAFGPCDTTLVIWGSNLSDPSNPSSTFVWINGRQASILYASPSQINAEYVGSPPFYSNTLPIGSDEVQLRNAAGQTAAGFEVGAPVVYGVGASDGGEITPGGYISFYGSNLGDGSGVIAVVGGYEATVTYDSPGQVNAMIPSSLPPGSYQALLSVCNALTTPKPITVD